jgi:hypothetical protein
MAFCFIGHGAWGVITKSSWLPFFATFGIGPEVAYYLMPLIGLMDICLGLSLFFGVKIHILYFMLFWTLWTAALRPIAGMSFYEFFERAGNFMPAFILIRMLKETKPYSIDKLEKFLKLGLASLLVGHAGFYFHLKKNILIEHFHSVGIMISETGIAWVGFLELTLALFSLLSKRPYFFILVLIWKLFTELLYPAHSGALYLFETIERWGDYAIPWALFILLLSLNRDQSKTLKA